MPDAQKILDEMIGSCLVMRTRLLARGISGIYDQQLRPFGLNSAQFSLLMVISKLGSASRAEIGRRVRDRAVAHVGRRPMRRP